MGQSIWGPMLNSQGWLAGAMGSWLIVIVIWSLIWKGLALWRAGRNNSPIWFVVLLVVNTVGILEILYYFIFSKMGKGPGMHRDQGTQG